VNAVSGDPNLRSRDISPGGAGPHLEKLLSDLLLTHKISQRLRASAFDVVHAHHHEGLIGAWPAAPRCGVPIVYDAHTMLASELPAYFPGPMRPLLQRLGGALDR
jgi:glycosyl transferase family 4